MENQERGEVIQCDTIPFGALQIRINTVKIADHHYETEVLYTDGMRGIESRRTPDEFQARTEHARFLAIYTRLSKARAVVGEKPYKIP